MMECKHLLGSTSVTSLLTGLSATELLNKGHQGHLQGLSLVPEHVAHIILAGTEVQRPEGRVRVSMSV